MTLIAETHAPDDVYEEVRAHFSEAETVNLTVLIGAINAWNRIAIGFRAMHPVKVKAASETRRRNAMTDHPRHAASPSSRRSTALLPPPPIPPATTSAGLSGALPNVPGKVLSAVVVNYAPGGKSAAHHHAGSVFAFILSGAIRSEGAARPGQGLQGRQVLLRSAGIEHLVSENASATEPASLLAVFVADEGAQLTVFEKK